MTTNDRRDDQFEVVRSKLVELRAQAKKLGVNFAELRGALAHSAAIKAGLTSDYSAPGRMAHILAALAKHEAEGGAT